MHNQRFEIIIACLLFVLSVCVLASCDSPDFLPFGPKETETESALQTETETEKATETETRETTTPEIVWTVSEVVYPSCVTSGYTLYTDGHDHVKKDDYVPPVGHDWGLSEGSTAPTCTNDGINVYECLTCGETCSEPGPEKLGHKELITVIQPTCTEPGKTVHTCERCGMTYEDSFTAPKGHHLEETVTEPTCQSVGYTTFTCTDCGYHFIGAYTEMKPHAFEDQSVAPTCTDSGYTLHLCKDCGFQKIDDPVPPLGHVYATLATPPTKTSTGHVSETCSVCGDTRLIRTFSFADLMESLPDYALEEPVFGCDLSSHNGIIDFEALKAKGMDFVILKIGSSNGPDATFEVNYEKARAAGLHVGAYYYTYALTVGQAALDVSNALFWLSGYELDYPVFYDMEEASQEALGAELTTSILTTFMDEMIGHGYLTGIYTNKNWLAGLLDPDVILPGYPLWLASWTSSGLPDKDYSDTAAMWQYASETIEGGVTLALDLNLSYIDFPALMRDTGFLQTEA